jgi:uncharacterized peroxidase-related enzyme
MSWIKEIPFEEATGKLKQVFTRVAGANGYIDNVLKVHSLRPQSLTGHMTLYKNVLHHSGNTLPKWYLELLGVYVSSLNGCPYCVDHHFEGLKKALPEEIKNTFSKENIANGDFKELLESRYKPGTEYARKLTVSIDDIEEEDVQRIRLAGMDDGQILEINQVVSYFNYANRTVIGLGVNTDGDVLGLSPDDQNKPEDWAHD